ncbi:MAG: NifU family protein [Myxococcota bacterium]
MPGKTARCPTCRRGCSRCPASARCCCAATPSRSSASPTGRGPTSTAGSTPPCASTSCCAAARSTAATTTPPRPAPRGRHPPGAHRAGPPGVHADGGDIEPRRLLERRGQGRHAGACRSCPASSATLRHGVERTLREAFPGRIERIEAV